MLLTTIFALVTSAAAATVKVVAGPKATYLGCFASTSGSFITPASITPSNLIIEHCMAACHDYPYFSVKKGTDCRCSKSPPSGATAPSMCTLPCTGNRFEICGGSGYSNFYALVGGLSAPKSSSTNISLKSSSAIIKNPSPATTTYIKRASAEIALSKRNLAPRAGGVAVVSTGCFPSASLDSYFSVVSTIELQDLRVEDCMAYCTGSTYFGVAYGTTCFCYIAGSHSAPLTSPLPVTSCLLSCTGNQFELCGGSEGVYLYAYPKSIASSCVAAITSSKTSVKPPSQITSTLNILLPSTTTTTTTTTTNAGLSTPVIVVPTCSAFPIINGGFESMFFNPWTYYNPIGGAGGSWSIAAGKDAIRGGFVAQVTLLNPNTSLYGGFLAFIMQKVSTCIGRTYSVSFQYQCTQLSTGAYVQAVIQTTAQRSYTPALTCSSANTWYTGSLTWIASDIISDIYIQAVQNGVTQFIVQFDNIALTLSSVVVVP